MSRLSKIMMATAYAHKGLTGMEREQQSDYEECWVYARTDHPQLGKCLVGEFVCGIGAFNVHFPMADIRPATEEERTRLMAGGYASSFGPSFRLTESDFATGEETFPNKSQDQL
jgi:hypothetical protein